MRKLITVLLILLSVGSLFSPDAECGNACKPIPGAKPIAAKTTNHVGSSAGQRLPAIRLGLERTS